MTTQSKRQRIRYRLILGTSLSLSLLGIGTARASLQPGGWGQQWQDWAIENLSNPLEDILAQIEETTALAEETLQSVLGDQWEALKTALGSNLPDPSRVRMEDAVPIQSILGTDPTTQQRDLANRYDQEVARSMASPWLGDQGQTRLSSQAEQTSNLRLDSETSRKVAWPDWRWRERMWVSPVASIMRPPVVRRKSSSWCSSVARGCRQKSAWR